MKHRIAMLKATPAAAPRRAAGLALVGVLSLGVGLAAWAAQPARIETRRVTITGPAPAEVEAARRQADAAAVEAEAQRRSAAEAHAAAEAERRQVERQRVAMDWEVRAAERTARLAEIRQAMAEQRRAEADARAGLAEQSAVAAEQARVQSEVARVAAEQARVAVESALRDSRASMRIADETRAAVTSAVLSAVADELSRQGVAR